MFRLTCGLRALRVALARCDILCCLRLLPSSRLSSIFNGVHFGGASLAAAVQKAATAMCPLRRPRWMCVDSAESKYERYWAPVPPAVYFFQSNYKGVDIFDQIAATGSTRRTGHRWYL